MAKYMVLNSGFIKDTEENTTIPNDPGNSHYRRYQLWLEGKDAMGNDLGTGPNTADVEDPIDLDTAIANKISELKGQANGILSRTDWYVIRNTETAVSVPSDITNHRASIRAYTEAAESEISGLSDVASVNDYPFNFPVI